MVEDVKVPLLPESVSDAVVSKWHKNVGDLFLKGRLLLSLKLIRLC